MRYEADRDPPEGRGTSTGEELPGREARASDRPPSPVGWSAAPVVRELAMTRSERVVRRLDDPDVRLRRKGGVIHLTYLEWDYVAQAHEDAANIVFADPENQDYNELYHRMERQALRDLGLIDHE